MAFPNTAAPTETLFATSVTSMAVNMPATVNAGDLLIAYVQVRNAGTWSTVPSGWNPVPKIGGGNVSQAGGGSVGKFDAFYKIADGTEDGGTATWIHSTGTSAQWHVRRVTDWHGTTPPEGTTASGDATNANPPSATPSWGSADNLFLVSAGNAATGETTGFTAAPTNYTGLQSNGGSGGGATVNLATAYRQLTASSDDPGTFTPNSNRFWTASTIVVRPAGASNESPEVVLDSPADEAEIGAVELDFTGTDADDDDITYQIQIDTVNTFDSGDFEIEFIGKNEAEDDEIAIPTHQAGDLIVMFAARDGNNTAPTVPGGWTNVGVNAGTNCAVVVASKVASSGSEVSGTWANANKLICHVYRNADHITRHAGNTSGGLPGSTINFPSISAMEEAGVSWGLRFAYISVTDGSMETPPSGFVNRSLETGSSVGEIAGHDTNGAVESVGFASYDIGGTGGDWITQTIEIVKSSGGGSGPVIDAESDVDSGFTNLDNGGDTDPFNSGDQIQYTPESGLSIGVEYFWRVRGKDPDGTDTYGDWSATRSFTVVSGSINVSSDRNAKITGSETANSERNAKITGLVASTSERNAKIHGTDQANSERSAKIVGSEDSNSERSAKITGNQTANSERPAKITGTATTNSQRSAKVTGSQTANSQRSAKIIGAEGANSERSAKIIGTDTEASERNAKITGKQETNSERPAKITGAEGDSSERNAKIIGKQSTTSERSAKITGLGGTASHRQAKVTGTATANSQRSAKVVGKQDTNSQRSAKVTGNAEANSQLSAKVTGKQSTNSQRNAKIIGIGETQSERNAKITGVNMTSSQRSAKITGYLPDQTSKKIIVAIDSLSPIVEIRSLGMNVEITKINPSVVITRV